VPNLRFTDLTLQNLAPPSRTDYWDTQLAGFGIRVGARTKMFVVKVKNRRISLGRYPNLTLKDARRKAHHLLGTYVQHGTAPFLDVRDEFITEHCQKKNKPSTAAETRRLLHRFTFSGTIGQVTKRDVLQQLRRFSPSEANHAFAVLRTLLNWSVEHDYLPYNPLHKVKPPHQTKTRDRLLTDDEIRLIWAASHNHGIFGTIVRCLILSGQRLNQIGCYDPAWKGENIEFPPEIMKSNKAHMIPCTPLLETELRGHSRMISFSTPMQKLRAELDIPHWTLHDFRRFFSSTHARIGTPLHITERLMDHTTGSESAISKVYNRYTFAAEMRTAQLNYESHLARLTGSTKFLSAA